MSKYVVDVDFGKPEYGYWNGRVQYGTFRVEGVGARRWPLPDAHPGPGFDIKWGCFALNYWFIVKSGRSWKEAATIAARHLKSISDEEVKITVREVE